MSKTIALLLASLVLSTAGSALAQSQTPNDPLRIKVWIYGDGNSSRMFSELQPIADGRWTLLNKTRETTGTANLLGFIFTDLQGLQRAQWPDVVVIGYAASAASLWFCASSAWTQEIAEQEAADILFAASMLEALGVSVLLSKGPGVPVTGGSACMENAFKIVWELTRVSGHRHIDWSLPRSTRALWTNDAVHISCDPARYNPPQFPNSCLNENGVATPRSQRQYLGSATLARRVKKAIQDLQ